MLKKTIPVFLGFISLVLTGQEKSFELLLGDSSMVHSSVSLCITDAANGEAVFEFNPQKSLIPASILKLVTSSAALELLGPEYRFKTTIGYTGTLNKSTGRLSGDIVIKGGGDPSLGSAYFPGQYGDFPDDWITTIINLGIKKVDGRVITDDSYYDYQPVPAKWLWEDPGNYYGAGVYGLSVFDNTYKIHFRTSSEGSVPLITKIVPKDCTNEISNMLVASGTTDRGYVFASPYGSYAWIAGSIPVSRQDFILKASIPDPPLLIAKIVDSKLDSAGIIISGIPTTTRIEKQSIVNELTIISEILSPPLSEIIEVLNHESVNLYAETLLKEMGKVFKDKGSTAAGIEVINQFLIDSGTDKNGMFMEDGSGLSPLNAISSRGLVNLLLYMRNKGRHFKEFYSSLPDAGKEGTLKSNFRDPVFNSSLTAKSGSMTRVRSYAGFIKAGSGKEMAFCIIINNYTGTSQKIISGVESILKETILNK